MGNADTRFLPDSCYFALQFDLPKLLAHEKMGSKNLALLERWLKELTSIELSAMKTLTLQFCEGANPGEFDEDCFGIAMTFSRPVNRKGFQGKMEIELEEGEVDGRTYLKSTSRGAPSIYFGDDGKTIVMGLDAAIRQMIGKKSGDSVVGGMMRSADPDAEIRGGFQANQMYRAMLTEISNELPIKPFNIEKVFGEVETGSISCSVRSSTPLQFLVNAQTEEGAEQLAKKGKLLVDLASASIPLLREQIKEQEKTFKELDFGGEDQFREMALKSLESSRRGLEIGELVLKAASTSHEGKKMRLQVKRMEGLRDVVPIFVQMVAMQFESMGTMMQRFEKLEQQQLDLDQQKEDFKRQGGDFDFEEFESDGLESGEIDPDDQ